MITYRLEIVGGPWDGVRGLVWADDGDHPVPERIWVGQCRGDQTCDVECPGRRHPAFWVVGDDVPTRTVEYEKEIDFVEPGPRFDGTARYALGGLDAVTSRGAEELVPAGVA